MRGGLTKFLRLHREQRRGRCGDDAPHRPGRIIVVQRAQPAEIVEVVAQRFRALCAGNSGLEVAAARRPAPAQHHAQAQALGLLEQDRGPVEADSRPVVVVVIGDGRAARKRQLDQSDARRQPQQLPVEGSAEAKGHGLEPGRERGVDAPRNPLEQGLREVVVGVHPGRVDHAVGGVEHALAGFAPQRTDGLDAVTANAQVAGRGARLRAPESGQQSLRALHEQRGLGVRGG